MPKKVLDTYIVHGFRRRGYSCFTSGVDTVNIWEPFSYALNIGLVIMRIHFRSPVLIITFFFVEEGSNRTPCNLKQWHSSILRCNRNTWKYFQFSQLSSKDHLVVQALVVLLSFFYLTEFLADSKFAYNQQLMLIIKVASVLTLDSCQHFSALYSKTFR